MILLVLLLGITTTLAVNVEFHQEYEVGVGWRLTCSWSLPAEDRLQSVRLYRDDALFMIYRPEVDTTNMRNEFHPTDGESSMRVVCSEERYQGNCTLDVEPLKEPKQMRIYTCEVSGERPKFLIVSKNLAIEPYVHSSDATIDASEMIENNLYLNCSAFGIPAPTLSWRIGEIEVPADFTEQFWNSSARLVQVWSSLIVSPKSGVRLKVLCTPKQKTGSSGYTLGLGSSYILEETLTDNSSASIIENYRLGAITLIIYSFLR